MEKTAKKSEVRPVLSDSIEGIIDGEAKRILLDFIEYCKENRMSVRLSSGTLWGVFYKGKRVATIEITIAGTRKGQYMFKDNAWIINVCYLNVESAEFEDLVVKENLSEIIYNNVCHCKGCLKACIGNQTPGVSKKILGRVFNKVCVYVGGLSFKNPDIKTLNCVKKLMKLRKNHIIVGNT